jgi:hypothetical protein
MSVKTYKVGILGLRTLLGRIGRPGLDGGPAERLRPLAIKAPRARLTVEPNFRYYIA